MQRTEMYCDGVDEGGSGRNGSALRGVQEGTTGRMGNGLRGGWWGVRSWEKLQSSVLTAETKAPERGVRRWTEETVVRCASRTRGWVGLKQKKRNSGVKRLRGGDKKFAEIVSGGVPTRQYIVHVVGNHVRTGGR